MGELGNQDRQGILGLLLVQETLQVNLTTKAILSSTLQSCSSFVYERQRLSMFA